MPPPPASPSLPPLSPTVTAPSPSVQQLREAFSASSPALAPTNSIRHPSTSPRLGTPKGSSNGNVGLGFGSSDELGMSPNLGVATGAKGSLGNVTSPQELTAFVDSLLVDLEARFDGMSQDVLGRLSSLSTRVDSLESSIAELMSGTAGGPVQGDPDYVPPQ